MAGASVSAAVRATYAAFIAMGFAFASWASRIPQVKDRLDLDASQLGLVLLAIAVGSAIGLPLSGTVVGHFGARRAVTAMALTVASALAIVGVGYRIGVVPVVAGLFAFGLATGIWDVAMNVHGALAERLDGRAIMPRFHAGFSLGTVAGAGVGALMIAAGISVTVHLVAVAVIVAGGVPFAVRGFLVDDGASDDSTPVSAARGALRAWRERRTVLVGVFLLAFALAEGAGTDWIGVGLIDGHGASPAVATLGFAAFLASITAARWFAASLLDTYGRVPVVRTQAIIGIVGLGLFAFGGSVAVACVGAIIWGVGISLGFPVAMSAGADEPEVAAQRVSVVSSIGYLAFLTGPPLIGFLGKQFTVPHALTAVIAMLVVSVLISSAIRPLTPVASS